MSELLEKIKGTLKNDLAILWVFSVVLGLALIVLGAKNKLPLGMGDFFFISIITLFFALYRPRWIFYLFVSLVPLENIILASGFLPMQLRPYQYTGAILAVAIFILWAAKRLNFKPLKPSWLDWLVFSLVPFSFLALLNSPARNIALKNNLVLLSFVVLYFLVRNFVRTRRHLVETLYFFSASNLIVLGFGFWQVFADKFGGNSLEVMFGRPNSVFAEPDWLGMFLCFALAVLLSLLYYCHLDRSRGIYAENQIANDRTHTQIPPLRSASVGMTKFAIYFLLFLNFTLLVLTLSRSAWIGAGGLIFFFLLFNLFQKNNNGSILTPAKFGYNFLTIFLVSALSLAAVYFGHLSKFDIFDRARSTATSEQKITIACGQNANIPQLVANTDELEKYGCQHINLEEVDLYNSRGKFVTEIFRKDPNVMTRSQIYRKSLEAIKTNPIWGVGFGAITQTLGTDARGSGLNESNIFLQVWAGAGILGLISLAAIFGYIFVYSFRRLSPICPLNKFFGCPIAGDDFENSLHIFCILGLLALIVPNLFNAGILMGIFWLGIATIISLGNLVSK